VVEKLPDKVEEHLANAVSAEVRNVLATLKDEELKVLADVGDRLDAANAPDHVKAQIV
jgi:hypothetical protein